MASPSALPYFARVTKAYKPQAAGSDEVDVEEQVAVRIYDFVIVDQVKRLFGKWLHIYALPPTTEAKGKAVSGWVPSEHVQRIKPIKDTAKADNLTDLDRQKMRDKHLELDRTRPSLLDALHNGLLDLHADADKKRRKKKK